MNEVTINTPRDQDGTFDPLVVRKCEKILTDSLADRIIDLSAIGNSTREISDKFSNLISAETINSRTNRVLPVQDILIACIDGLKGFHDAIASVFTQTTVHRTPDTQLGLVCGQQEPERVHARSDFAYLAVNKDVAEKALDDLEIPPLLYSRTIYMRNKVKLIACEKKI